MSGRPLSTGEETRDMARRDKNSESSCPHNNAGCSPASLCADCERKEDDMVLLEHVANCQVKGFCAICHMQ